MKNIKKVIFLSVILSYLIPATTFAAQCQFPPNATVSEWINCVVNNILSLVLWPVFLTAVVVMVIWIGFLFLTAKGEPSKISQATKSLMWVVIGVAVALLAFSAVVTIRNLLGIT